MRARAAATAAEGDESEVDPGVKNMSARDHASPNWEMHPERPEEEIEVRTKEEAPQMPNITIDTNNKPPLAEAISNTYKDDEFAKEILNVLRAGIRFLKKITLSLCEECEGKLFY